MLREPDLSQYLAGIGGFQSPDDHYAGFVRSVPADLPDDRVASDFIGDPGGDGVSYGMAGVQSVYRHLLPEEDWKAVKCCFVMDLCRFSYSAAGSGLRYLTVRFLKSRDRSDCI